MTIYIFRGEYRDKKDKLLMRAARMYAETDRRLEDVDLDRLVLKRSVNGKPYFDGLPFHFSLSHTGGVWGCFISKSNVGLDIQERKPVDHIRLAERFFLTQEKAFVEECGPEGFFDIWTRKEACVKYYGGSIFRNMRSFQVVADGKLAEKIEFMGRPCFVGSIEIGDAVKCAYCRAEKGDGPWVTEL